MLYDIKHDYDEYPMMFHKVLIQENQATFVISDCYGSDCLNVTYVLKPDTFNKIVSYLNKLQIHNNGNQLIEEQA